MMKLKIIAVIACILLIACKPGTKTQFDNLEKVFETGNWKVIARGDTSFLFFSRENDALFKVYKYKLQNGDSAGTVVSTIRPEKAEVVWDFMDDKFMLENADEKGSSWHGLPGKMEFTKTDSSHILFNGSHTGQDTMVRTLPISTFLVRSKYDFLHGAHTASATADTVRRKKR